MKTLIKVSIYIGGIVAGFFAIVIGDMIFNVIFPGYGMGYMIDLAIIWFFLFYLPKRLCAKLDRYLRKQQQKKV